MKILKIATINRPNVFSHSPVLVMSIDLERLAAKESYEIPGFVDRLLAALPGLHEHHCGLGRPGAVLRLSGKGRLAPGCDGDLLVLEAGSLALRDVVAGGRILMRDGLMRAREEFLNTSTRRIHLDGAAKACRP
jgi:predicted amidohydrolase